jgi:arylsulfatase A-like enzyme
VEWKPLVVNPDYPDFSQRMAATASSAFYNSLEASPYGNELVEALAERAIEGEQLGRRGATDLLTVSFSSNDYVGHQVGPDAPQVRDMALRVDRSIGKLFEFIDRQVGLDNTLIVLTADHGVAPLPEVQAGRHMPGGRHSVKEVAAAVKTALETRFGAGDWVLSWAGTGPYLNWELIRTRKLDEGEVQRVAAAAVAGVPHIFRVFTRDEMLHGHVPDDAVSRAALAGFVPRRSGDLVIVEDPYWIAAASGATHGAPFGYDTHVPVIFMGPDVKPGRYDANVAPNDIAPTLATLLDIETPSGTGGRVLAEMLVRP